MSSKNDGGAHDGTASHRRRFLQGIGATGIAGVFAGCLGDNDENGEENGGENGEEAASFTVAELDPAEVTVGPGDSVSVTATIENDGDSEGTQTISLVLDGEELDSEEQTIDGGDSAEVSFSIATGGLDGGDYEYTVSTDDDEASGTLTVDLEPASFQISNLSPGNVSVAQGDSAEFGATVSNTGDEDGTQAVTLSVDGDELASQDVTVSGGSFESVSFGEQAIDLEPGEYEFVVASDDDDSTGTLTVKEPPLLSAPYGINAGGAPDEPSSELPVVIDGVEFVDVADVDEISQIEGYYNEDHPDGDESADWYNPPAAVTDSSPVEIEGADQNALYETEWWDWGLGLDFAIENGTYDITFHFTEVNFSAEGERVFDLEVQGETVLEGYDIYAEAGGEAIAVTETVEGVEVTDNLLEIRSTNDADATKFCGIEIRWGGASELEGLRSHYRLDGDEPVDATGNYDATIQGEVETGAEGVVGDGAYQFNGGHLELPEFGIDGGGASFSLWFNADALEPGGDLYGYRCLTFWGDDAPQFEVNVTANGNPAVYYWDGSAELGPGNLDGDELPEGIDVNEDAFPIETGEWYHYVMVYDADGGMWTLYLNGEAVVTLENDIGEVSFDGTSNTIGDHPAESRFFEGRLDDVRYYSSALSADDVQTLYSLMEE